MTSEENCQKNWLTWKWLRCVMDTELLSRPMFKRIYNLIHLALRPHETFLRFIIKLNGIFLWMMGHLKETVNI